MPIYKGNTKIIKLYKGSTQIVKRYKGTDLIYSASRLPSEFQEVEYIESTGSQYIDTQWIPSSNSRVEVSFAYTNVSSGDQSIFGSRDAGTTDKYNLYCYNSVNTFAIGYGTEYNESALSITLNQKYNVVFTANGLNGNVSGDLTKSIVSAQIPNFNVTLFLFARNRGGTVQQYTQSKSIIYILKIYDNNTLVRDFVPCYRKADNVAGLYDLVNGVFYTNAGTGTFIVGGNI